MDYDDYEMIAHGVVVIPPEALERPLIIPATAVDTEVFTMPEFEAVNYCFAPAPDDVTTLFREAYQWRNQTNEDPG